MDRQGNSLKSWEDCYQIQRSFLISFAFRMTGSLMDAEDIVQDTVAECLSHDFDKVVNHCAWMTRICSNKALDLLKSAYKNRNTYVGTWLPDMIPDQLNYEINALQPDLNFELSESLTISFLVLLQTLGPTERAVFLLKDVFGYSFKDISQLLGKAEPACRKIAERARVAINVKRNKFTKPSIDSEKLIRQFFEAAQTGDRKQLETLLADQSEFLSDGGDKAPAAPMMSTKEKIVEFFMSLQNYPIFTSNEYRWETTWVNSRPGMIITKFADDKKWQFETVMSFEIEEQKIVRIFAQRNPDKLKAINIMNEKQIR